MKSLNKTIGTYGEDIACTFLENKGYTILTRNFHNRYGEIDVICQKSNILSFVEVKTRYFNSYGLAKESITQKKIKNIIFMSSYFITKHKIDDLFIRFDVIEIYLNVNNDTYTINFIKDAFRA